MPRIVAKPMTPEWYAARSTGIGASEIAAAAGLSPYATPLEIYRRKRGEQPEIEDNEAMRLGRALEPVVRSEFMVRTGINIIDQSPPMARHDIHDPITATPDGIIDDSTLFEAKTASWRMKSKWGDEDSDAVPDHYLCQVQSQMSVWNAGVCHLAVLFDGATLKTYKILRNDELIRLLIGAALELWDRIRDGRPPEPTWEAASTPQLIREIHSTVNDFRIQLTEDECELWRHYEMAGKAIKQLENYREVCKSVVLHSIGDNYAGVLDDGRMIRRKLIEKEPFTVTPKPYYDCRAVKCDGGRIIEREEFPTIPTLKVPNLEMST